MTAQEILKELKVLGKESIKSVLLKHGAKEPFYGVKVQDLKVFQKKIKKDYGLAKELYDSGISDAMYLAGLIADESKMTKAEIQAWADKAHWSMIIEYTVPWVASESRYGYELGLEWINSDKESLVCSGWTTLASLVSIKHDKELDINNISCLLERVKKEMLSSPDRVKYSMNSFVIAVGSYVSALSKQAIKIGEEIGPLKIDMGDTSCKVPFSPDYIKKATERGSLGKKRKTAKC